MSDGFPNKPKILRGAFVEFGLSLPPLLVVFQYNPLQLTRNRTLSFAPIEPPAPATGASANRPAAHPAAVPRGHREPAGPAEEAARDGVGADHRLRTAARRHRPARRARRHHRAVRHRPPVRHLGADGRPKSESLLGALADLVLGKPAGFSFTRSENPPLVLFVFGRKRVLPVNITSMNITETEFSPDLNPVRATVAVSLTVIEGKSVPYLYSKAMTEACRRSTWPTSPTPRTSSSRGERRCSASTPGTARCPGSPAPRRAGTAVAGHRLPPAAGGDRHLPAPRGRRGPAGPAGRRRTTDGPATGGTSATRTRRSRRRSRCWRPTPCHHVVSRCSAPRNRRGPQLLRRVAELSRVHARADRRRRRAAPAGTDRRG